MRQARRTDGTWCAAQDNNNNNIKCTELLIANLHEFNKFVWNVNGRQWSVEFPKHFIKREPYYLHPIKRLHQTQQFPPNRSHALDAFVCLCMCMTVCLWPGKKYECLRMAYLPWNSSFCVGGSGSSNGRHQLAVFSLHNWFKLNINCFLCVHFRSNYRWNLTHREFMGAISIMSDN